MTKNVGGDLTAEIKGNDVSLDEAGIRKFVDAYKLKFPDRLEGVTFISTSLDSFPGIYNMQLINGDWDNNVIYSGIKTVSPNFLEYIKNKHYIPNEFSN